jgi:hypothetical protein
VCFREIQFAVVQKYFRHLSGAAFRALGGLVSSVVATDVDGVIVLASSWEGLISNVACSTWSMDPSVSTASQSCLSADRLARDV